MKALLHGFFLLLSISLPAQSEIPFAQLKQAVLEQFGILGESRISAWQDLLELPPDATPLETLKRVNDHFNEQVAFDSDLLIWGESDFWATPAETLGIGAGDCEDFSIGKYISLLLLGIPDEKLRITYVKATIDGYFTQAHMVLAYYPTLNSEPLILDNLNSAILPASQRKDLQPIFSFNGAGLWVAGSAKAAISQPETRLSKWRDLLARLQSEGIRL